MNYREEVKRTANTDMKSINERFAQNPMLLNAAVGLMGEAGEVGDLIKKAIFHGAPFDREKLIKECGDLEFYLQLLYIQIETTREEVQTKNVEKLRKRYPDGFSTQASIERKDVNG